jgi:Diacylglycerol kinase catalytic domain
MRKFQRLIGPCQVVDLKHAGPAPALAVFKHVPNFRVLACGGDGTVGWVLQELDKTGLDPLPPVGIVPLGTGNDLARTLGWGAGYTDESISEILSMVCRCAMGVSYWRQRRACKQPCLRGAWCALLMPRTWIDDADATVDIHALIDVVTDVGSFAACWCLPVGGQFSACAPRSLESADSSASHRSG